MISDEQVQQALAEARSVNTPAAWDNYEEVLAAKAHEKAASKPEVSPLEAFCELNPYAPECRIYDV